MKTAVRFGADAVYCGGGSYSLRAADTSFNLADLEEGINFAHKYGCRVYLALNIFAFDEDIEAMMGYLTRAVAMGIDAVIVSDPGVIYRIREMGLKVMIHLSTQANTTNSLSARFWREQGVDRIVLARELSLSRTRAIKEKVPEMELEVFIHGAMCIAYSGRCLLSAFLSNRSANRGGCNQPCRWEYRLKEAMRDDELTIGEDERGAYILNSRDLCMIGHIPELAASGVDSLKIEGRMKTAYYVAAVTRIYRAALDEFKQKGAEYEYKPEWLAELKKVSHRPYTTGFYLPCEEVETEYTADSSYVRGYDFVGTVDEHDTEKSILRVKARNRFFTGDVLEILDPGNPEVIKLKADKIYDEKTGCEIEAAHNSYSVRIPIHTWRGPEISKHSVIRAKTGG